MSGPCTVDSNCLGLDANAAGALMAEVLLASSLCGNALACLATGLFAGGIEFTDLHLESNAGQTYTGATKLFSVDDGTKGAKVTINWTNPSQCLAAVTFALLLPGNDQVSYATDKRYSMSLRQRLKLNGAAYDSTQVRLDNGSLANGIVRPARMPLLAGVATCVAGGAVTWSAYKEAADVDSGSGPYPHPDIDVGVNRLFVLGWNVH